MKAGLHPVLRCAAVLALASSPLLAQESAPPPPVPGPSAEELRQPPADATRHPSGLVSKVLREGFGQEAPDDNDIVLVQFTGWTSAGQVIQSTRESGQPMRLHLVEVFPGWREGMTRMVAGEIRRLWIPESLGSRRKDQRGDAVFDVELVGIERVPNLRDEYRKPPADAERTPAGAFTLRLQEGQGEAKPGAEEFALLAYTGWHPDGRVFDTTVKRGRPSLFPMNQVLPAFAECARQMVVGETRMCWIPGAVAAGQWMGGPKGDLIFEMTLIQIMGEGFLQPGKPPQSGG